MFYKVAGIEELFCEFLGLESFVSHLDGTLASKRNRETNLFKFLELYDFLGVQGNWFIWHFGYLLMGFKGLFRLRDSFRTYGDVSYLEWRVFLAE